MILSDKQIYNLSAKEEMIRPFSRSKLQPASYDLSLSGDFIINGKRTNWWGCEEFILYPHQFMLASTAETVRLPKNVAAIIRGRSSSAREGLEIGSGAGYIDPGYRGVLTLSLFNQTNKPIDLKREPRVAQIVFFGLSEAPFRVYSGNYQGSRKAAKKCE